LWQFSIRSIAFVTFGIAVTGGMFVSVPMLPESYPFWFIAFLACGTVTGGSVGFDVRRTEKGAIGGALTGLLISFLFIVWLSVPRIRT
jgi:hypothetical protein